MSINWYNDNLEGLNNPYNPHCRECGGRVFRAWASLIAEEERLEIYAASEDAQKDHLRFWRQALNTNITAFQSTVHCDSCAQRKGKRTLA
jgi:hypothetical protein